MYIHDLNLTSLYADKVLVLKGSKIYAFGKPNDVLTEKTVREVYGVNAVVTEEDGAAHVRLIRK